MITMNRCANGASAYPRTYRLPRHIFTIRSAFSSSDRDSAEQKWWSIIDELLRVRNLKDNWDGEGALAPPPELVDSAITLAKTLKDNGVPPPDRVHASVNATVYFEWYNPLGYGEIEVVSPVDAQCRFVHNDSGSTEVVSLFVGHQ